MDDNVSGFGSVMFAAMNPDGTMGELKPLGKAVSFDSESEIDGSELPDLGGFSGSITFKLPWYYSKYLIPSIKRNGKTHRGARALSGPTSPIIDELLGTLYKHGNE